MPADYSGFQKNRKSKMIIVKLMGGLGNQMFQYALGRRLSLDRQVQLKLDLSWYEAQTERVYQLNHFMIDASLSDLSVPQYHTHIINTDFKSRLFRLEQRLLPYKHRRWINENGYGFNPNILKVKSNIYLTGYWQSEKYFLPIEKIIREDFKLKENLHSTNQCLAKQIQSCRAVSIHVRRGDYLDSRFRHYYFHCDTSYYKKGMEIILHKYPDSHFFVFSDDLEWVKQNLPSDDNIFYIENNDLKYDWESIYLMSLCKHHIIANSSFSWWGAWLNENPEKIVIAPSRWYASPKDSSADIIPEKWIKI